MARTPLVLLDPREEYARLDHLCKPELFTRCTDADRLEECILDTSDTRLCHIFLPDSQRRLIDTVIPLFENRIFYVSCVDQWTVKNLGNAYNYPAYVKTFHAPSLLIHFFQVATLCLTCEVQRAIDGSVKQATLRDDNVAVLRLLIEELMNDNSLRLAVEAADSL